MAGLILLWSLLSCWGSNYCYSHFFIKCQRSCSEEFDICLSSRNQVDKFPIASIMNCVEQKSSCKSKCHEQEHSHCWKKCMVTVKMCFSPNQAFKQVSRCVNQYRQTCANHCHQYLTGRQQRKKQQASATYKQR